MAIYLHRNTTFVFIKLALFPSHLSSSTYPIQDHCWGGPWIQTQETSCHSPGIFELGILNIFSFVQSVGFFIPVPVSICTRDLLFLNVWFPFIHQSLWFHSFRCLLFRFLCSLFPLGSCFPFLITLSSFSCVIKNILFVYLVCQWVLYLGPVSSRTMTLFCCCCEAVMLTTTPTYHPKMV